MKTRKTFILTLVFLIGFVIFQSCENEPEISEEIIETVQEEAVVTAIFDNVFAEIEKGENNAFLKSATEQICPILTIAPALPSFPKTITLDFGTVGCEYQNGNVIKGRIITIITGWHWESGSVTTATFENFSINGFSIAGSKTITNMGRGANNFMAWRIVVANAVITSPEGRTFRWNSDRLRRRIAGEATPLIFSDDVIEITGTTTGVNHLDKNFSSTIINPLILKMNCRFIVQGSVELKVQDRRDAILDYGVGTCDDLATITVNGETKTIRLKR